MRSTLQDKLRDKLGEGLSSTSSELTEVFVVSGKIAGKSVNVTVTRYPRGENPETYDGDEMWSVALADETGKEMDRYHNPEASLELAFDMIDWGRVRNALDAS